ncbi:MAG TPA: DsbA family protein [Acidimicrobiales bacterium]
MTVSSFAVTWDYRCPFARNAHEHLVAAIDAGAGWEVQFVPFSLDQTHVHEGDPPVWDSPDEFPALLAMQAGIVVRDRFPKRFLPTHVALFAARHDEARDTREREVVADVLNENGVDAGEVFEAIQEGWPLEAFRKEHEAALADHHVFGVPTFIAGGQAAFVRVMTRPRGDSELGRTTIERILDLTAGWSDLNELKHTSIPR